MLGKSPKLGQQPKFGWANFFQILAGPKFGWANYGWAKFWLGQILAGPNFGWANFFHIMAGPKFGWADYGWATFLAEPIFSTFWLGQSLAAGPVLAGPILLDRYYGWAILAGLMAGSLIGPTKN